MKNTKEKEALNLNDDYMKNTIKNEARNLNVNQRLVYDWLLRPISIKKGNGIYWDNNSKSIVSSYRYKSIDPDMSDFAIGFYEIIYDDIYNGVDKKVLNNEGEFNSYLDGDTICYGVDINNDGKDNNHLAGDTMNSYRTIARFASDEKSKEWKQAHHCLANFWLLPFYVGRQVSSKSKSSGGKFKNPINAESFNKGRRDYMDRFLKAVYETENGLKDFLQKSNHYIYDVYVKEENKVIDFSIINDEISPIQKSADDIINKMWELICKRAKKIVLDKEKCGNLYEYFKPLISPFF